MCIGVVGNHMPGWANNKHVLRGETPTQPLAGFAGPQPQGPFGKSRCPGPHCWMSSAAVSPLNRWFRFKCPCSRLGSCTLGVPAAEQLQRERSYLGASSSTGSNNSAPRRVHGGPCWGTKGGSFQLRTLQTPCCAAATHLRFIEAAFLCENKEKG